MYYDIPEGLGLRKEAGSYATILNKLVQQAMRKGFVRNLGSNVKNIFTGGVRNVPGNVKNLFNTRPQYPSPKEMSAIRDVATDQYFGRYWDTLDKLYAKRAARAQKEAINASRTVGDDIKDFGRPTSLRKVHDGSDWYYVQRRGGGTSLDDLSTAAKKSELATDRSRKLHHWAEQYGKDNSYGPARPAIVDSLGRTPRYPDQPNVRWEPFDPSSARGMMPDLRGGFIVPKLPR